MESTINLTLIEQKYNKAILLESITISSIALSLIIELISKLFYNIKTKYCIEILKSLDNIYNIFPKLFALKQETKVIIKLILY